MTPARYSAAAITLHWLIALALAFQISLGWTLEGPSGPALFARFQLHKSVGITILMLSLVRLAVRLAVPRPAPSDGPLWTRRLAEAVHWGFYVVMIGAPLAGWLIVSTAKIKVPTLLYGIIPLPNLPVSAGWNEPAKLVHSALAFLAVTLFVLHVAGALRHQWLLRKPELQRMIPFAHGRGVAAIVAALALVATGLTLGKLVSPDAAPGAKTGVAPPVIPAESELTPKVDSPAHNIQAPATPAVRQPLASWAVEHGGRIGFTARWNDEPVRGQFKEWHATIRFSPDQLGQSSISATINLASAGTGDGQRDEMLHGGDFFDTATHATAVFTSRRIERIGGDRYEAKGNLSLKGVTRPVTLRFTLMIDGTKAKVAGTARIDRTAYGVGLGEWESTDAIAAAVAIDFDFSATRH